MKRRLNRIRKENQVLVHKVHLLCWLAHGNFVNSIINRTDILATALSLMPSEKSFPSDRTDLAYLEQILGWFKKTVKTTEKLKGKKTLPLDESLLEQMKKKEVKDNKMLAIIFVALLRSFGVQTRLVLSLQVEPLRPPASDLHYVGSKNDQADKGKTKTGTSSVKITVQKATPIKKKSQIKPSLDSARKVTQARPVKKLEVTAAKAKPAAKRSKSAENSSPKPVKVQKEAEKLDVKPKRRVKSTGNLEAENKPETSKETKKPTAPTRRSARNPINKATKTEIVQLDGLFDSSDDSETELVQLDGATENATKPNLKNLKVTKSASQKPKEKRPNLKVLKNLANQQYSDSDSEFEPAGTVSFQKKLDQASTDLKKLKDAKQKKAKSDQVKEIVVGLVKDGISRQKEVHRTR